MRIESKARCGAHVKGLSARRGLGGSKFAVLVRLLGDRQLEVRTFDQVRVAKTLLNFEPFSWSVRPRVLKTNGSEEETSKHRKVDAKPNAGSRRYV